MRARLTSTAAMAAFLALAPGAGAQQPPAEPALPVQPPVETPVAPPPIPEPPPGEPPAATVITDDEAAFAQGEEPARLAPGATAPPPPGPAVAGAQASAPASPAPALPRGATTRGQLPFTGPNAGVLALLGALFCALGLGLRRWIAAPGDIFMA
jgi:hypothetical protein